MSKFRQKINITKKSYNHFILFWVIILSAIVIRIVAFAFSENSILGDMQAMDRILIVKDWLDNENLIIPAWSFGPLHLSLLKILFRFFDDHLLVARLNSFFFGIGMLFLYYLLILYEFKDRQVSLLSLLFLSLLPVIVLNSVVSQAMSMFNFFIILSLIFFIKSIRNTDASISINLILSGIFLNFAGMVRFEGWFFVPILGISILFFKKFKFRYAILFVILCSIFPLYWIFLNYEATSNPFYFLQVTGNTFKYELSMDLLSQKILGWPKMLIKNLGLLIFIPSILGIILSLKLRKSLFFLGIFLVIFFIFEFATIINRYDYSIISRSTFLCLFIIPYASLTLVYFYRKTQKYNYIKWIIPVYIFISILFSLKHNQNYIIASTTDLQTKEALQFINKNCFSTQTILIDELKDGFTPYFIVKSNLPTDHFRKLPVYFTKNKIIIDEGKLTNIISRFKPEYIISAPYCHFVKSDILKVLRKNGEVILTFSNDKYLIYKLTYENNIYN